jgi:hypothetical protein
MMSLFPPGGNGMMMVMGRVGYDPITGAAGCARAANGHAAAALLSSVMNSRRLTCAFIRSPRRQSFA